MTYYTSGCLLLWTKKEVRRLPSMAATTTLVMLTSMKIITTMLTTNVVVIILISIIKILTNKEVERLPSTAGGSLLLLSLKEPRAAPLTSCCSYLGHRYLSWASSLSWSSFYNIISIIMFSTQTLKMTPRDGYSGRLNSLCMLSSPLSSNSVSFLRV